MVIIIKESIEKGSCSTNDLKRIRDNMYRRLLQVDELEKALTITSNEGIFEQLQKGNKKINLHITLDTSKIDDWISVDAGLIPKTGTQVLIKGKVNRGDVVSNNYDVVEVGSHAWNILKPKVFKIL